MKRLYPTTLLLVIIFLAMTSCHKVSYDGETGRIIYTHFKPAININFDEDHPATDWDTIFLDFNKDGTDDMMIYFAFPYYYPAYAHGKDSWQLHRTADSPVNELNDDHWTNRINLIPGFQCFIRHQTEEGYCYGWLHYYMLYGNEGQHPVTRFYLEDMAYCTCPNYPIKWGEK